MHVFPWREPVIHFQSYCVIVSAYKGNQCLSIVISSDCCKFYSFHEINEWITNYIKSLEFSLISQNHRFHILTVTDRVMWKKPSYLPHIFATYKQSFLLPEWQTAGNQWKMPNSGAPVIARVEIRIAVPVAYLVQIRDWIWIWVWMGVKEEF